MTSEFDPAALTTAPMRWTTFSALILAVGAVTFDQLVLRLAQRAGLALAGASQRARALAMWSAAALLPLAGWRLIQVDGLRSAWGFGWWWQIGTAVFALVTLALSTRRPRWQYTPIGAVLLLALTPAFAGHAGGAEQMRFLSVAVDGAHVLAVGAWLGTLCALGAVGLPLAARMPVGTRAETAAALIRAFSPVALTAAAFIAWSGLISAWLRLGSFSELWRSAYGWVLLLKLLLVGVMAAFGAWNWKRTTPALTHDGALRPARLMVWREIAAGAAVLLATAVLAATPFPAEGP